MGTGPVPPGLLVTPVQLSRYGVPSDFLSQFQPRPFTLQITAAGALGAMAFAWQYPGDPSLSVPMFSTAGATWQTTVDGAFADLTFAAATYGLGDTYTVDTAGHVSGPSGNIVASLWDQRQVMCSAVTTEAMSRMRDAIHPPLMAWGDDATRHAAAWVYALLKRSKGATPTGAGSGDENIFTDEKAAQDFFDTIGAEGRPDSMTDTSATTDGPLFSAYPTGDTPRDW